jgi:hypothetical protein
MHWRRSLLNFSLASGAVGIAVPLVLILRYLILQQPFGIIEDWLWPSSIMLMALEASGTTRSTVVFVHAFAIAVNALLYATIGAIVWFAVFGLRKLRHSRR